MFNTDIGIDLGTATVLVYIKGRGIVLNEPSVVAVNTRTNTVCAVGAEADRMIGRTPPFIKAVRPLNDGVISSYTLTEAMVRHFIKKAVRHAFGRTRIMMCVPTGVTDVEQRAVIQTAREAGAKDIFIIEEPVAAAIGAGYDISKASGVMVVDMGGGTTDIAVLSLGGIVASRSVRIAGDEFSEAVARFVRRNHRLLIGPKTAEALKINIGTVKELSPDLRARARGIDIISGLPREAEISGNEMRSVFEDYVYNITERVHEVLEETPPDLQGDIISNGIIMTGGGSLIQGLDERISEVSGIKTIRANDIVSCVAKGAGRALELIDKMPDPTHTFYKKAYIS